MEVEVACDERGHRSEPAGLASYCVKGGAAVVRGKIGREDARPIAETILDHRGETTAGNHHCALDDPEGGRNEDGNPALGAATGSATGGGGQDTACREEPLPDAAIQR